MALIHSYKNQQLTTILLSLLLVTLCSGEQLWGVRWSFGDHYSLSPQQLDLHSHFQMQFNTLNQLDGQIYLQMGSYKYPCLSRFLFIENAGKHHEQYFQNENYTKTNHTSYLYRCTVGDITPLIKINTNEDTRHINYDIVLGWMTYDDQKGGKSNIKKYTETVLFSSVFRVPSSDRNYKALVMGDWGIIPKSIQKTKGYVPILPCLLQQLKNDTEISIAIFLGDLAYDFQGQNALHMVKYLQPLTSQIVFMVTPGNHDSYYHIDSYKLFVAMFHSPQWNEYSNYFYTFGIGNLAFISWAPEAVLTSINRVGKNMTEIFEKEFPVAVKEKLKKDYVVVSTSHYAVYCSYMNDSMDACQQNPTKLKTFLNQFTQMGLDLYLGAHLHLYERTYPVCNDGTFRSQVLTPYNFSSCPVFITEGAAGNQYYVQMNSTQYPWAKFTTKLIGGTGFGLLSVVNSNGKVNQLTYHHFNTNKDNTCNLTDTVKFALPSSSQPQAQNIQSNILVIVLVLMTMLGVIAGIYVLINFYRKPSTEELQKQKNNNHVQMVEESVRSGRDGPEENQK